ncbi:hypothetical protein LAZ67_15001046 [Cordylochernes scorpioides]|uniref:Retroviral polymerase SH3-like domain-containing protein n=1 Tax=Cordylochernes scorpioides TaxID=51811 RepID=A0ABY6LB36_9ARAC|nr:hypothetical protein LAZ67_15001046 [Cordylochernes scorpioides]
MRSYQLNFGQKPLQQPLILNNCTLTKNELKTPIEKWTGHEPSVAHLKIFGSLADYYIPKNKKIDSRARKGIFTGYSKIRKSYRIYDPQDGKIHEDQTVKIDENSKGSDLLNSSVFDQHVQDQITYRNKQQESDFFRITPTVCSTLEEPNTPENPEPIPESSGLPLKFGRIAGRTNEDIQEQHLINLREQEERLIASDNFEEHLRRLKMILNCLKQAGLCLNEKNVNLGQKLSLFLDMK